MDNKIARLSELHDYVSISAKKKNLNRSEEDPLSCIKEIYSRYLSCCIWSTKFYPDVFRHLLAVTVNLTGCISCNVIENEMTKNKCRCESTPEYKTKQKLLKSKYVFCDSNLICTYINLLIYMETISSCHFNNLNTQKRKVKCQ